LADNDKDEKLDRARDKKTASVVNATQMNSILGVLSKSITGKSNKSPVFNGVGYVYFAYP
jgi:hypothetical protein